MTSGQQGKQTSAKKQAGYVLLLLVSVVLVTGLGLFVSSVKDSVQQRNADNVSDTLTQLKNLKKRLLAIAASHPELYPDGNTTPGPGYFPCPSTLAGAQSDPNCAVGNETVAVGWMPRLTASRDINVEAEGLHWRKVIFVLDLRYALDSSANGCGDLNIINSRCAPLNHTVNADRVTLSGKDEQYVALLIFAGNNLNGQQRNNNAFVLANYLEAENADGDGDFEQRYNANQNDIIIGITQQEWLDTMRGRIALDCPGNNNIVDMPNWYSDNQWQTDAVLTDTTCPSS